MGFHQRLIRDVLNPLDLWRRGEAATLRYLREFERTQYLPAHEIQALQDRRLRDLLDHAFQRCPFYRERFESAGLVPSDIATSEDLTALPTLEKVDIQRNRDSMVASGWPKEDLIADQTGGSTGTPLSFYLSRDRKCSRAAATIRHNRWAGWDVGDKVAYIWGAPRDIPTTSLRSQLRNTLINRQLFLDTACITEKKLAVFHLALKRFRPRVLLAYAQGIVLFARYLRATGLEPYQPRSIVTSAEVLNPDDRALVEETFGCPIFNRYGCREVSVIASECEQHRGLHTMAEGLLLEVVRDNRFAGSDDKGSILVTDLLNFAMPLIRYRIGDVGAWETGDCPCGRKLRRLQHLNGRITDFLVGTHGQLVSGVFLATYVVAKRPSLAQLQILQERRGEVHFRVKASPGFQQVEDIGFLESTIRHYLGETTVVTWELVDQLNAEPSGKFRFCISRVTPEFL